MTSGKESYKEYREKGISKKLMQLLEDAAREQGYRYLYEKEIVSESLPGQFEDESA